MKDKICDKINDWITGHNGYTTTSLANELGVTFTSVKRWQTHVCLPEVSLLPKLCKIMNITLYELFDVPDPSSLSLAEKEILSKYHSDPNFKTLSDKYFSDPAFKSAIESLLKISK